MIILAIVVLMIVNKNEKIPAAQYFALEISLLLAITIGDSVSRQTEIMGNTPFLIALHTVSEVVKYIIRPLIIMIELLIILKPQKPKLVYFIPAAVNAVIFSTALFGSRSVFYIDEYNHWHRGSDIQYCVYIVQLFYVFLLLVNSIRIFRQKNIKRSIIVFLIFFQSLSLAFLEAGNHSGYVNLITALCILEYYIYLSAIYHQEIKDEIARKELDLTKSELIVLREQIQPHFIKNTLSIIRYLAKHDSKACVQCIDEFSKYLNTHLSALQSEEMIPFERELTNVSDYISLVQTDHTRKVETVYELGTTDFMIPPLLLEPLIENAVDHGLSRDGGVVKIKTYTEDDNICIVISDSGSSGNSPEEYRPLHNGIGLENTRKRLEIQCRGTLTLNITENGAEVTVTIPRNTR